MLLRDDTGLLDGEYLRRIISPRSIAVVGASDDPTRIGGRPIAATISMGFSGAIYPVNPKYDEIFSRTCYPSLSDLPEPPDLVVVSVGAKLVESVVKEAADVGAGALVVFSSGYAELAGDGEILQRRLADLCEERGIALLGPNCLGVINTEIGSAATFTATFESGPLERGSVGFACQSGAFGSYFLAQARRRGLGVHSWIATGNEAVVSVADCIAYLVDDPSVSTIAGYIEGVRNGRALTCALERANRAGKPVVLLKAGRSEAGSRAALSHTGAMVGDDEVFDAVLSRYGVYRAQDLEDLLEVSEASSFGVFPRSKRAALLTVSGGVGIMMADQAERSAVELPSVPADLKEALRGLVPFAGLENPIDFTGQFLNDANIAGAFLEEVCRTELYDSVVMFLGHTSLAESLAAPAISKIVSVRQRYGTPIFFSGLTTDALMADLRLAGIPVLENPVRAVRLLAAMADLRVGRHGVDRVGSGVIVANRTELPEGISSGVLPEQEALELLGKLGIGVIESRPAADVTAAVHLAEEIGYPVVIKADCPSLMHKTEAGAVALNLWSESAVCGAFESVVSAAKLATDGAEVRGVLVQGMARGQVEFIVGGRRDAQFGPVIMVGTGGVLAEMIGDMAVALADGIDSAKAVDLIGRTAAGRSILSGRFSSTLEIETLADVVVKVSELILSQPRIAEIDINPVLVTQGAGAVALDALVIIAD